MRCERCGNEVGKDWRFCPHCGSKLEERELFPDLFSRVEKEFREMDKLFERNFEVFDLSPWFKKPRWKGFSIKIVRAGDKPPKVSVRTYGDVDKDKVRKEVYDKFGIKELPKVVEEEKQKIKLKVPLAPAPAPEREKLPAPRVTEEPKTDIRRIDSKVVVDIQLPEVKEENIEVKELEASVEVKALTSEKAYFKILTKPAQFKITSQSFSKGILHLEFS